MAPTSITIAAGQPKYFYFGEVKVDGDDEGDETVTFAIDTSTDYNINAAHDDATGTIKEGFGRYELASLSFGGDHTIKSDDGNFTYGIASHWSQLVQEIGLEQEPLAYTRGADVQIESVVIVAGYDLGDAAVKIKATGPDGIKVGKKNGALIDPFDAEIVGDYNHYIRAENLDGSNLKDKVWHYDDFVLDWQVSVDDGEFIDAGSSNNDLYLTLNDPTPTPLYYTVLHIGSNKAKGEDMPEDVFAKVWTYFETREVERVDGTKMKYWGTWAENNSQTAVATTVPELLKHADGKCGAWAGLLRDVLAAQGINADFKGVKPILNGVGIIVNNATFPGSAAPGTINVDGGIPVYHENTVNTTGSVPAQNNDTPRQKFKDHAVVIYDGKIYDPSYGRGEYDNLKAWENAALAGVTIAREEQGVVSYWTFKNRLNEEDTRLV
ncbi:MAG: hypothetical protein IH991_21645 [Planctomycetes bacterium]|nr:hypothetical protein [Planctomycetota bacterium]